MFYGHSVQVWLIFHAVIIGLLVLDLGLFNKKSHVVKLKEAIGWSIFWIAMGALFGWYIYEVEGSAKAIEYFTGYVVEKSLSVDNLFVFTLIFTSFKVDRKYQHRLLFWGILGAIVMRAGMILAGTELLLRFHWLIVVFGVFLVYSGFGFLKTKKEEDQDYTQSKVMKIAHRYLNFTKEPHHGHLFVREAGRLRPTDLFAVLIMIEASDIIFALDSVPAVMGITKDPFIVYTSNIFAILGLRSLFFVLEDLLERFHLLNKGIALILMFVGAKMILDLWFKVEASHSLMVIGTILFTSSAMSLVIKKPAKEKKH